MRLYWGFWEGLDIQGKIHACLTIRRQLVANENDRTATGVDDSIYNVDRSRTLVLEKEAQLHSLLDAKGLRWDPERKKELFLPTRGVNQLISSMRQIVGETLYLFDKQEIYEDLTYKGGNKRLKDTFIETNRRTLPERGAATTAKLPTITIKLSKTALEQLRGDRPIQFQLLYSLLKEIIGTEITSGQSTPETIRLSRTQINNIRNADPNTIADLVEATRPTPPPNPAPIPRPVPVPRVTRQAFVRAQQEALDQPISTRLRPR